jgi:signal transduction histidine kinase
VQFSDDSGQPLKSGKGLQMRILVVDDNVTVRRSIRSLLSERPDWSVCAEAADGIEAVEKARKLRPDTALIDVAIPRMNGLEAARIIRSELPQTKIVIISQNDASLVRQQADEVKADAFVPKSELPVTLVSTLERVMLVGAGSDSIFPGDSEMALLMRGFDWTRSELGPPEDWPNALKTSVRIILTSRHPMFVWWGDNLINLYNDGYARFLLSKHPSALAKPAIRVWPEIWDDVIVPRIEFLKHQDSGTYDEAMAFVMLRRGFPEETYATFSYSPILNDDGRFGGILCPVTEDTQRIRGQRQMALLRELAAKTLDARNRKEACTLAASALRTDTDDLLFALIYELNLKAGVATLQAATGVFPEGSAAPKSLTLNSDSPWLFRDISTKDRSIVVSELTALSEHLPKAQGRYPVKQAIVLQLAQGSNDTKGALVIGLSPLRPFDYNYREFLDLVSAGVSSAIQKADAYEAEKRRAEALAEIDRTKTAFFNNVSHEFRTPLTLMLRPLQDLLTRSETHLSPEEREQLELVNRNGARLLRLVNTLLDFSRIEAGRARAVYQATDVSALTADLASTFRSAIERAGLKLSVDCRDIGEPVYVDSDLWEKIVLNLLSNAFKFTFEGEIAVSMERAGSEAELSVRDTGVGIAAAEMPKLFERFHRIPNTRSRTFEGSGIGLALVQELVKLHGGSISVESAVEKGSTFTVRIPLGQDHLPPGQVSGSRNLSPTSVGAAPFVEEALRWLPDTEGGKEPIPPAEGESLPPMAARSSNQSEPRARLLVADDNADMRQYLVRMLHRDYEVEAVANGREAIDSARKRTPDLVLSDVMMPILDGFELIKALRENEHTRTIPVILLSARAGEESRVEGMLAGADDYLVKPFSARELQARVSARLEIARLQRDSERRNRDLAETLEGQVRTRTLELEKRNAEILVQADQLLELSGEFLRAQDEERRRIARELHDSTGQTLVALGIEQELIAKRLANKPDLVRQINHAQALTQQLIQEIRTTSYLLHPPLLDDTGLDAALRWYVDGLTARSGIEVDLQIPENIGRLPATAELAIFRIVQEALTNIHRHSKSKDAVIRITRGDNKVSLEIEDHGTGMSAQKLAQIQTHGGGVGFRGMRERLRQLRGEISIGSSPTGTKISLQIPVRLRTRHPKQSESRSAAKGKRIE